MMLQFIVPINLGVPYFQTNPDREKRNDIAQDHGSWLMVATLAPKNGNVSHLWQPLTQTSRICCNLRAMCVNCDAITIDD